MSSAIIWIFLPILAALILLFIPGLARLKLSLSMVLAGCLSVLAWAAPIGSKMFVGLWTVKIYDTFSMLGRTLTLSATEKPLLTLIYAVVFFWFLSGFPLKIHSNFGPLALIVAALLVASLAVEPFLYGALLIELAVIVSVIFLAPSDKTPGIGVLRYLIFQTLGIPFILFAGWMLDELSSGTNSTILMLGSVLMLGIGFSFLLAVFPFNAWLPMLIGQAEPYETGFILVLLPACVILFGLHLVDTNSWLRSEFNLFSVLQIAGVLMIATGGIWAAFEKHLGRMLGYAVIMETGYALLSIGLRDQGGLQLFAAGLLTRALAIWAWSFPLSVLQQRLGALDFKHTRGLIRSYPFLTVCLLAGQFTVIGLPLFASFSLRTTLFAALFVKSTTLSIWAFVGTLGLFIGSMRSLGNMLMPVKESNWRVLEKTGEAIPCLIGFLMIFFIGIFPQMILPRLLNILATFTNLL